MASLGRLPEFSGSAAEWEEFTEQLLFYFTANSVTDEDKQRAILLSACEITTYKLLKTLVAPAEPTSKSFSDLVKLAQEHHNPKPSAIMRRFRFNTCMRQEGESITAYVTRLRDLASHCEYGDSAKELIRDRLVCGVRDDTLQHALLAIAKLTFDRAFELALLHESAAQNACVLHDSSGTAPVHFADPSGPSKDAPSGKSRYRCGGNHYTKDCRFKDAVCSYCHKKGHIQHVCRNRMQQWQPLNPEPQPAKSKWKDKRQTYKLEEEKLARPWETPQVPAQRSHKSRLGNLSL